MWDVLAPNTPSKVDFGCEYNCICFIWLVLAMHQKAVFIVKLDEARAYVLMDTSLCCVFVAGIACWRPYSDHYAITLAIVPLRWPWPLQTKLVHAVPHAWMCPCVCLYARVNVEFLWMYAIFAIFSSTQIFQTLVYSLICVCCRKACMFSSWQSSGSS